MQNKKRSRTAAAQEYTTSSAKKSLTNDLNRNTLAQNRNRVSEHNRRSVASLFSNYVDSNSDEDTSDMVQAPKRLALQDSNISRYEKEFLQISQIGLFTIKLIMVKYNQ